MTMAISTADQHAATGLADRPAIAAVGQADLTVTAQHMFALMFGNLASDGYAFADPTDPSQFSRPGCIIVSPSYHLSFPVVDQDYVFNWTRDAAVTAVELAAAELPTNQPLIDDVNFAQICENGGPPSGYAYVQARAAVRHASKAMTGASPDEFHGEGPRPGHHRYRALWLRANTEAGHATT
jgi:hypothetical protein